MLAVVAAFQVVALLASHQSVGDIVRVQVIVLAVGVGGDDLPSALASTRVCAADNRSRTVSAVGTGSAGEQRLVDAIRASLGDVPVLLCGSRATGAVGAQATTTCSSAYREGGSRSRSDGSARSIGALTRELGAPVTVNPLPTHLLGRPVRNLLVWKIAKEGRLLASPRDFSLPVVSAPPLDAAARFSYLLTALLYLVQDLEDERLPDSLPENVAHGVRKALLHVSNWS